MTLVNTESVNRETGEPIDESDVRASIRRVIDHAESIWNEWAWQVENKTWEVLGYESWDEMRRVEYSSLTSVTAPRAERPELVSRFRNAGLTQRETADTLGVGQATVSRHDPTNNEGTGRPVIQMDNSAPEPADEIVDGEIVEDDEPQPIVERHRTDVVTAINKAILRTEEAAAEAAKINPSHLRNRKDEAATWSRRLESALGDVQHLLTNLKEIQS